jgi:hypothetical protein
MKTIVKVILFAASDSGILSVWTGFFLILKHLVLQCTRSPAACPFCAMVILLVGLPLYFMMLRLVAGYLFQAKPRYGPAIWFRDYVALLKRTVRSVLKGEFEEFTHCETETVREGTSPRQASTNLGNHATKAPLGANDQRGFLMGRNRPTAWA